MYTYYNHPYGEPLPDDAIAVRACELRKGDCFMSDRASEGLVEARDDYGVSPWDDRPDSIYVRRFGTSGDGIMSASWFIAIPAEWWVLLERIA